MSNAVAKVSFLQGQAWAKTADGSWRALTVGSTLNDDEVLVTAQGARIELDTGNGEPLVINGGLTVGMSRDLLAQTATEADEALLSDASVQKALTVLEQGGDLFEELEETAAGNASGGASEGHSFVQLTRLIETTDSQSFDYSTANPVDRGLQANDGEYTNRTPVVDDQVIAANEDEPVTGQVIVEDIEGDTITFTLTTPPVNGVVTLDPVTGQFTFTPNANYNGSDSFIVTVSDSHGNSADTSITLSIAPVNDAPAAANLSLTTLEDMPVNGQVQAKDIESDSLSYSLSRQPANGSLVLDPATGAFVYTPNTNYNGSDSFVVAISDGKGGTTTSAIAIGVTPVNDLPLSSDRNLATSENTPIAGQIAATDVDGDSLDYAVSSQASNGTISLNPATGGFVYTPNANYSGSDSFTVTITDGNGAATTSLVSISVTPVNDAPVASNLNLTTDEDTPVMGTISAVDADGDTVSFTVSGNPASGSVVLDPATGAFVYTPNTHYIGSDSFVVTISDGKGGTATSTIAIGVSPVNDSPVSSGQSLVTQEDIPISGQITASDMDGDILAYAISGQPAKGAVSLDTATGSFVYTPEAHYNGSDSFVVTISDGKGGTTTSTIAIDVNPVNDAPVSNDQHLVTDEAVAVTGQITANDVDGDILGYTVSSQPAKGTISLNTATGSFVYTPDANYNGNDSFVITISDGKGGTTTSTITIGVTPVNDAPQTGAVAAMGNEDTLIVINLAGTDVDGSVTGFVIKTLPANGVLYSDSLMTAPVAAGDLVSGPVYFMPNANWNGATSLTYTAQDNLGLEDATPATVSITVNPVADAAVLGAGTGGVKEDTPAQSSASGMLSITDPDAGQAAFQAQTNTPGTYGSFSINSAGSWTYSIDNSKPAVQVLKEGETKTETFTVTSLDGTTSAVVITVTGTNEAPVANGDIAAAIGAGNIGLVSEYFGYSDTLNGPNLSSVEQLYTFINGRTADATFIAKTFDYGASSSFNNNLGNGTNLQSFLGSDAASLSRDPVTTSDAIIRMRGFVELGAGTYNFKVTADDGYQIRVDGVVVAQANQNQSTSTIAHTQFTLATAGLHTVEVVYWDQGGYAKLKLELSDDAGASYELLSSIPAYQHTLLSAVEDTALSIPASSLLANDTDANGDTLSIQSVQGFVNCSVTLVGGSLVFTPAPNYSGPASFTYTLSDGQGGTATATVNLSVAPVNDAPVAVSNSVTVAPNATLTIPITTLLANDTDIEGDKLTIVSVQNPLNGNVSISGSNLVFVPIANYEGPASFTYTVRDPMGATSTATVNVSVGAATAPSLVVLKSLLAVAQGTAGTSVKFPVVTALVDTDGSETLTVRISNVPTGLSFNAGTNLGSGVWLMQESDLPNLMLNLPESYSRSGLAMTVQVISTEINGGATASVSNTVMLHATYTTVEKTTTTSGNLTGTSANEHIVGGDGDNVIAGSSGNDVIEGGAGNDTLSASSGSDMFYGGAGNDLITGSAGIDRINGGSGNDTMSGGADTFVDVFSWSLGDQGAAGTPAVDTINNFVTAAAGGSHAGGDVLDLRDLLIGEHVGANNGAGNLADFLHFEVAGGTTTIHISHTGGFSADTHTVSASYSSSAETQKIVLNGVDLQSHYSGATTDQQIITQLLNNNKLITD